MVTRTQQKYAKLNGTNQVPQQLVYPSELLNAGRGLGHFVLFNFNTITGTQFKSDSVRVENQVESPYAQPVINEGIAGSIRRSMNTRHQRSPESVAIYMPQDISTNYGVDWATTELGMAGRLVRSAKEMDNISLADVGNTMMEESRNMITGAIQTLTPINAQDASELLTGTISNPFVEVLFKGVTNREMTFEFKFAPKNAKETATVREIIRRFKFHMHPEYKHRSQDSSYLLHPSTVDATFMYIDENGVGQRNQFMHRLSTCAITNVMVNETPDDGYKVHHDNSPVTTDMTISLMELEQLHKGRFTDVEETF